MTPFKAIRNPTSISENLHANIALSHLLPCTHHIINKRDDERVSQAHITPHAQDAGKIGQDCSYRASSARQDLHRQARCHAPSRYGFKCKAFASGPSSHEYFRDLPIFPAAGDNSLRHWCDHCCLDWQECQFDCGGVLREDGTPHILPTTRRIIDHHSSDEADALNIPWKFTFLLIGSAAQILFLGHRAQGIR